MTSKTPFLPGLELSRRFYQEAVRPVLDAEYPDLPYSAALIGPGSEVLGFDTPMSANHHWGPRVMLFLAPEDFDRRRTAIHETLRQRLPHRFLGWPTNFADPIPEDPGTRHLQATESGPVNHRAEMYTIAGFVRGYLGFDLTRDLEPADWLTCPEQKLCTLTAGAVYHDGIGLQAVRGRFAYYPHDVWLYLLAAGLDAHRPGGAPDGAGGAGRRRDRVCPDRQPARPRPDAALLLDGTAVRALSEVVRHGVPAPGLRPGAGPDPASRPTGGNLAGARSISARPTSGSRPCTTP